MARILHCADLHLDRSFAGPGLTALEAERRRRELRAALSRIVDLAIDLDVDALTVGGDLYEDRRATRQTGSFVAREFARLAAKKVLIAPGNHDPFVPGSLYDRVPWPNNVHIFRTAEWTPVPVAGVTVWGAGHTRASLRRNLLRELRLDPSSVAVALLHAADVATPRAGEEDYCAFELRDVERCGASFVLLGHDHKLRLGPAPAQRWAYPGSPEPLGFFTEGPHYVLLLTVEAGHGFVEPIQINHVTYRTEYVDTTPYTSSPAILNALWNLAQQSSPRDIVRVVLTGTSQRRLPLDVGALRGRAAGCFRYLELIDGRRERAAAEAGRRETCVA